MQEMQQMSECEQPSSLPAFEESGRQIFPLKVAGKTFRCDCGGNVFTEISECRYRCNSCRSTYSGQR